MGFIFQKVLSKVIEKPEDLDGLDTLLIAAMNTTFYFAVTSCKLSNWKEVMEGWVRHVEKEWSRFRTGNELGRLNQLEVGRTITFSPPFIDIIQRAEEYRRKTNGLFSPYLLPQMQFHGYENSFPFDTSRLVDSEMPPVYENEISPFQFSPNTNSVTRITDGLVDLGGIGKGYTVQAAAQWLRHVGEASAGMVDGGGDISVWSDGSKEWTIGVSHPYHQETEIAQLRLKNGGIATSNVVYRSWSQGDEKKHHIIDGRTGLPADNDYIQATVIAENCLDAEVGAKLCLIENDSNIKHQLRNLDSAYSFLLVNNQGKLFAFEMEEPTHE